MDILVTVAVLILLIAINALYVAAEFSAVSARRSRLAQYVSPASGRGRLAATMLAIVESPSMLDTYVAACQLGITLSSLILGYYGQARLTELLTPWLSSLVPGASWARLAVQSLSATVILLGLTLLQVVLGELLPKNVALRMPEQLALWTVVPLRWSMRLFAPLIWVFNGSGQFILRLLGAEPVAEHTHIHSPQEILMLVEESSAGGLLDAEERRLLVNTLQLRDLTARKVMIPRNRMLAAPVDMDCQALFELLANSPYSRLPLYEGTIDAIVGIVHLKDLLQVHYQRALHPEDGEQPCDVRQIMHPVLFVPDTAPVDDVMQRMQRAHHNLAIVVDEYGGTAGMITFEDLMEEIIGEFQDEFDVENPPLELLSEGSQGMRLRIRGDVLLDDFNDLYPLLGIRLPAVSGVSTVGGLVLATLGRIPRHGEVVEVEGVPLRVDRVFRNSVAAVSLPLSPEQSARLQDVIQNA
ncbi:MAG: hemolysin [Litorilinea sp.]|nr:MAG: hemolysin [Litorilinea sp.]